jgi:hypothetical protein
MMAKSKFVVVALLLVLLTILVAPGVLAGTGAPNAATPSGGRAVAAPQLNRGQPVPLGQLLADEVTEFCMIDSFGYMWDTTATLMADDPNYWEFTGTVDIGAGFDWTLTGYAQKVSVRFLQTYWNANNPNADGCMSGWVDYFEYYGDGTRRIQDGAWNNYCGGQHYSYGLWDGATYPGDC